MGSGREGKGKGRKGKGETAGEKVEGGIWSIQKFWRGAPPPMAAATIGHSFIEYTDGKKLRYKPTGVVYRKLYIVAVDIIQTVGNV